ncbi:MAG: hypothetical protein ACRDLU_04250 [Gaiellaceae bacterium]
MVRPVYDVLRATYTFACPAREHTSVRLSSFREVERLPGAAHPAVFRVRFACGCGEEHDGLVAHDDLDWAPLGVGEEGAFLNLMTARPQRVGDELADLASRRISAGAWPWVLYCYPEGRPRPAFPSLFRLLAPKADREHVGVAVTCSSCGRLSVNLVSAEHVDVPFHHDAEVGVVEHVFPDDALRTLEEFRAELWSTEFDSRRLALT